MATGRTLHNSALLPNGRLLVSGGSTGAGLSWADGIGVTSAEIFDPATGAWSAAAAPSLPRKYATSTVLPSGKVLMLGGVIYSFNSWQGNGNGSLYDPAGNSWTSVPPMSTFRFDHVATLLQDGRVLVVGGSGGLGGISAEIYNPTTETWSATGSPSFGHSGGHTATVLADGRVFVTGADYNERTTEIFDPAAGTWSAGPTATVARLRHTATLLPTGKVLIAGGSGQSSADLYDPVTNTLSATGVMMSVRHRHSATLLPNGKVVVMGGMNGAAYLSSVEIYDPATGAWSTSAATLATPRASHTATLLPDGRVAVAGGSGSSGALASMEIFTPDRSPAWNSTGSMAAVRSRAPMVTLPNGKVLMTGGYNGGALNTAELYDPATGTWSSAGIMVSAHSEGTATLMSNGKVLVAGNFDFSNASKAEIYDPVEGTWTAAPDMPVIRMRHTATLLPSGKVLAVGGGIASATSITSLYDPATNTWTNTGSLGTARLFHGGTLLPNGTLLVSGGTLAYAMDAYATCEVYHPATGTWSSTGTLNEKRYRHTSTLLPNGKVLVAGGMHMPSFQEAARATAELYDPATGAWTPTGPMATARYDHRAELLPDGRVIVTGGQVNTGTAAASVEIYDPASGTWSAAPNMAAARSNHGFTLLTTGKLLVAGGSGNTAELYDPGQSFSAGARPQVTTASFNAARVLSLAGAGFTGLSGASTGGCQDSSTGQPLVQLRSLGSGQVMWAAPTNWSATTFTSRTLADFAPGHLLMTVVTNGVPSEPKVLIMPLLPEIAVEQSAGVNIADGGSLGIGSVANNTPVLLPITVKNSGDSALTLGGVSVTGGNAADFSVDTTGMAASVAGGASTTFSVAFKPTATGSRGTTLQILSNDNDESPFDITLTGTGLNTAPTISDIVDQVIDEDSTTGSLPFSVGDFETATDSLTVTRASTNTTLVPLANIVLGGSGASRTVTVTPAANLSGTAVITVTVGDGTLTTSDTFLVTVNPVNDAPTLHAISNPTTVSEDAGPQFITLTGITAGGGESQTLVVTATSDNTALIPNPAVSYTSPDATGFLSYTPAANASGTAHITVTVNDGQAADNLLSRTFTVTVNAVNDAPTLSAISNPAAILEDSGLQVVSFDGIGAGPGESQALVVTASSNNTALIPHPAVSYNSPDGAGSLSYTPVANASGTATITVTVNDGQASNSTFTRTFIVSVTAVNDAPTLSSIASPVAIFEDAGQQTVSIGGISAGPGENQILLITATSDNTSVIPNPTVAYSAPSASGAVRYTPVANASGTATITVTVNDGQGADNTVTRSFTVTVIAVNDAPTLTAIANPAAILEDEAEQTIDLGGISAGPSEFQPVVITAFSNNTAVIPHPAVIYFSPNATGQLRYAPVANASGSATITVTVDDGQPTNNTFSRSFTVTVTGVNDAPTISDILSQTTNEDTSSVLIDFTIADLESSAASLVLSRGSSNTTLVPAANIVFGGSGASRHLIVTPAANQSGTAIITVTVSDGLLTSSDTFELTVNAVNDRPTVSVISNQQITYNTLTSAIGFTVGDVESAPDLLTVTAESSNPALIPNSSIYLGGSDSDRDVVLVPEYNQTGSATIRLHVSDGTDVTTASFTLTVNAPEIVVEQPFTVGLADGGTRGFGGVAVGGSTSLVFYIKNSNAASLTGLTITKDGPDASQFTITASPVAPVVGPAGNTAFTVRFTPASVGEKSAVLHIANNDPDESPFDILLTGKGTLERSNWRHMHFGTTADTGSAADLADPDNDGVPNLLEYALGTSPTQGGSGQMPQPQVSGDSLTFVFDEPPGITGVTYGAEWNATLDALNWTSSGIGHTLSNGRHVFTLPITGMGRAYIRLKVIPE